MLVLGIKEGQWIQVGPDVKIGVKYSHGYYRITIDAPDHVHIKRLQPNGEPVVNKKRVFNVSST
jgi:sRNA-binding carbon storage regulator CsrA